jgi:tRNA A37 methylthiotransferase MiaB
MQNTTGIDSRLQVCELLRTFVEDETAKFVADAILKEMKRYRDSDEFAKMIETFRRKERERALNSVKAEMQNERISESSSKLDLHQEQEQQQQQLQQQQQQHLQKILKKRTDEVRKLLLEQ